MYVHEKFKYQLMMRCVDKYYQSLQFYHDPNSVLETTALIKVTN